MSKSTPMLCSVLAVLALLPATVVARENPVFAQAAITELPVPARPGSAEPNLTRGAGGTIILSWLEPQADRTFLRFTRLEGESWSEPQTVASGDSWFVNWADFPSVLAVSENVLAAHWLSKRPGGIYSYDVSLAFSENGGKSWSSPITPHRDNTATEHGFVSLFPAPGGVNTIWLDGRNTEEAKGEMDHAEGHGAGGMTLRHALVTTDGTISEEIELDSLVCDCCQTSVAMTRQGPVAVYRNRTEDEIRDIYITRFVDGGWKEGQPVHADGWKISGCPVNGPAVAAQGDTVAVAWFTMAEDIPRVRFARSADGGITFGAATDVAANSPLGRVDLVLLDDGTAVVSWLDQRKGEPGVLQLRSITANGVAGQPYSVTQMGTGRPSGFPQMQSDGRDIILAWTQGQKKDSMVKAVRIPIPFEALQSAN
ncbi:MAG TPA: sialidase family protein [Xanthomonadales bacterium]|nr:sialidase family protein [Xanthomonadales bacterium]